MQLYSTNGYCKDAALLCIGNDCSLNLAFSKIYCGYNQTTNYCEFIGWSDEIINVGSGSCNNNYTEATCHNMITEELIAISSTFKATCTEVSTMEPTDNPTTTILPSVTPLSLPNPSIFQITSSMEPTDYPTTAIFPSVALNAAPSHSQIISPTDSTPPSLTNPSILQTISSMEPTNDPTTEPLNLFEDIAPTTSMEGDNTNITYLVIIIFSILVIFICIYLVITCFCLITRRKKLDEPVLAVQHNVQRNNIQNDIIDHNDSHESNESMYKTRKEMKLQWILVQLQLVMRKRNLMI